MFNMRYKEFKLDDFLQNYFFTGKYETSEINITSFNLTSEKKLWESSRMQKF